MELLLSLYVIVLQEIDLAKFGEIEDITDKGYYTNSYHVDVREEIDAFSKLQFSLNSNQSLLVDVFHILKFLIWRKI